MTVGKLPDSAKTTIQKPRKQTMSWTVSSDSIPHGQKQAFIYGKSAFRRVYKDGTIIADTGYGMYVFKKGGSEATYYLPHENMNLHPGKTVRIIQEETGFSEI